MSGKDEVGRFVHREIIAGYRKLLPRASAIPRANEDRHKTLLRLLAKELANDK
jgi:hypothetical protein